MMKRLILFICAALGAAHVARAALPAVRFGTNQLELVVLQGFNHVPQSLSVNSNGVAYSGDLTVTSDSAWAQPVWNPAKSQVDLTLISSNFVINQTATIRIVAAGATNDAFVHATISQMNLWKLVDDPARSRVYGVHAPGVQQGCVVVVEPLTGAPIGTITVGKKPTDLAVSAATDELLVLNHADKSISVINLATLTVKETIPLPEYGDWGTDYTSGNIQIGPGNIIYYTDGAWAPMLYAYNRATRQNIQKTGIDSYGVGDFALTSDKKTLIGWAQYGWSAGLAGSYISRFAVDAAGLLTQKESSTETYPNFSRDPLDTPVLIASDNATAFVKVKAVNAGQVQTTLQLFPYPVYSISPGGEIVITSEGIYERKTGNKVYALTGNPTVQTVTSDYARLVYFDASAKQIRFLNLLQAIGGDILGRTLSPANKAIVLPPSKLSWSPVPGVDRYNVYFGDNSPAVQSATTTNAEFLGVTSAPEIALNRPLTPGKTYYWRVDPVTANGSIAGEIYEFTVSNISVSSSRIDGATVQGYQSVIASVDLASLTPGSAWVAQGAQSWITFSTNNGVTPATLKIIVDASKLDVGLTNSAILVGPDTNSLVSVPLRLRVEPLALTILKSDPTSKFVYGVSENTQDPVPHAYLLEIDTENELITRIAPVGSSVTDLAIHNGDGRIYVPNWMGGSLLAINKSTFNLDRTYAFRPFAGTGYGEGDVYRISAGVAGRLVVEEEDQWITISIFDTVTGTNKGTVATREGGGTMDPTGRYYFHGDNNISDASIRKFDLTGDVFTAQGATRVSSVSYYGSRVVVMSEDGSRLFWNGSVFDPNLVEQWTIGDMIYSTTPDGRYAFAQNKIYDINLRKAVLGMPVSTTVSAYNSTSSKLVVQRNGRVEFFPFSAAAPLTRPVLTASNIADRSVTLAWKDNSLETSFTLQMRQNGSNWVDIATPDQNATQYSVTGLQAETYYEFRMKANSAVSSSDWSDVLGVTTLGTAPTPPEWAAWQMSSGSLRLNWSDPLNETGLVLERQATNDIWRVLARLPANTTTYLDTNVVAAQTYLYRVSSTNVWWPAVASTINTITIPIPAPPAMVYMNTLQLLPGLGVAVTWWPSSDVTSYEIERRGDDPQSWMKIATVGADASSYFDTTVEARREYFYRVVAVNGLGRSDPSAPLSIFALRIVCLVTDDFEAGAPSGSAWSSISGGQVAGPDVGFADGKALWFGGSETRTATTIPLVSADQTIVRFLFRFGNNIDGTNYWDAPEWNEDVVVEFSTDNIRWNSLVTLPSQYPTLSPWTAVSAPLPSWSWGSTIRIRWRQLHHSGARLDTWAIDNVCVQGPAPDAPAAPPFLMATSASSHSMALFWIGSANASEYVLERASGADGWKPIAHTGAQQTWFTDPNCASSTTYAYRVKALNAGGSSAYSQLAFGTTISQVAEWQVQNLGSSGGSITELGADGIPLLARFAFNTAAAGAIPVFDPAQNTGGLPAINLNKTTGQLEVTYLRRKAALNPGVEYHVQFSTDLKTWSAGGLEVTVTPVDETWEVVRHVDNVAGMRVRFGRVAVSQTP